MAELTGKRVLIFVGDDYEDMELQYPKYRLLEAGAEVVVAGIEAGATYRGKYNYPQKASVSFETLDHHDFAGVIVPGGWMPDKLRRYDAVKRLMQGFEKQGKLIASICHGPWIDISAGVVKGYRYTSTPGIKDDLVNAGAKWEDASVVVDEHHVSSRRPDDLPDFCRESIKVLTGAGVAV